MTTCYCAKFGSSDITTPQIESSIENVSRLVCDYLPLSWGAQKWITSGDTYGTSKPSFSEIQLKLFEILIMCKLQQQTHSRVDNKYGPNTCSLVGDNKYENVIFQLFAESPFGQIFTKFLGGLNSMA